MQCPECGRELAYGDDAISLQRGVIGPRGVVPLREAEVFCSDACLEASFDGDAEAVSRRIP